MNANRTRVKMEERVKITSIGTSVGALQVSQEPTVRLVNIVELIFDDRNFYTYRLKPAMSKYIIQLNI